MAQESKFTIKLKVDGKEQIVDATTDVKYEMSTKKTNFHSSFNWLK